MPILRSLLNNLVDYAGLFPPAGLPMDLVVRNYDQYLHGSSRWMLGRLIVPASRLTEFEDSFKQLPSLHGGGTRNDEDSQWLISALIPPVSAEADAFQTALNSIASFNNKCSFATVDTVEGRIESSDQLDETLAVISDSFCAFFEIPFQDPDSMIAALAAANRPNTFAKIRTGGVTADLIPPPERVANFLFRCAASNIGMKATAGLHHPIRAEFPLTYEPDSPRGTMHGFMNVFVSACFAFQQSWNPDRLLKLLTETDSGAFEIGDDSIRWRDHQISIQHATATRHKLAVSFGSCSFEEPLDDLIQLGWLETAAKTV